MEFSSSAHAHRVLYLQTRFRLGVQCGAEAEIIVIHVVIVDAAADVDVRGIIRIIAGRPKPPIRALTAESQCFVFYSQNLCLSLFIHAPTEF